MIIVVNGKEGRAPRRRQVAALPHQSVGQAASADPMIILDQQDFHRVPRFRAVAFATGSQSKRPDRTAQGVSRHGSASGVESKKCETRECALHHDPTRPDGVAGQGFMGRTAEKDESQATAGVILLRCTGPNPPTPIVN